MGAIKRLSAVMANPTAYRLWQAPFAKAKFVPILEHNDLTKVRRVLDVGCGPGTNSLFFSEMDYLGLDINAQYIEQAIQRFGPRFQVADVCEYEADPDSKFDFILLNSLLHHIDTQHTQRILQQLTMQLAEDGHIHILDLVLPENKSFAKTLALSDRGDYPRPLEQWREIFSGIFEPVVFEPYPVRLAGVTMWSMVYFKGRIPDAG